MSDLKPYCYRCTNCRHLTTYQLEKEQPTITDECLCCHKITVFVRNPITIGYAQPKQEVP